MLWNLRSTHLRKIIIMVDFIMSKSNNSKFSVFQLTRFLICQAGGLDCTNLSGPTKLPELLLCRPLFIQAMLLISDTNEAKLLLKIGGWSINSLNSGPNNELLRGCSSVLQQPWPHLFGTSAAKHVVSANLETTISGVKG